MNSASVRNWQLSDFDYELPADLIAQQPAQQRSGSRLLAVADPFRDLHFSDLVDLLDPGDVLVFNNSKVIPARLFGTKPTGGKVEILVERILENQQAIALLRSSKKILDGSSFDLEGSSQSTAVVLGRYGQSQDRFLLQFDHPILELLERHGEIPLPPYISHRPDASDAQRYQTVYAQIPGSIAAPTAGLHFDAPIFKALEHKGIQRATLTLHVGTGTFAPVRVDDIDQHQMHSEWCEISAETAAMINAAKTRGSRVVAVGTTSLRTLESGALKRESLAEYQWVRSGFWETNLFIRPGYSFKVVDSLLTNFHLPKSTLLMLVAAFIGYDKMRSAYQHAINARYRFFSYGDAMFCPRHL